MNPIHDGLVQGLVTLIAFVSFLGICFYAYSPSRRGEFEAASRLPVGDMTDSADDQNGDRP